MTHKSKNHEAKHWVDKSCTEHFYMKKARVKCCWNWHCGKKATSKIVLKFSPVVNLINILQAAFVCTDPKSAKWHWLLNCLFALLGLALVKTWLESISPKFHSQLFANFLVVIVDRWLLFESGFILYRLKLGPKNSVQVGMWLLFGGGRLL